MTTLAEVSLRQGDTLALEAVAQEDGGQVRDLTGVTATLELVHRQTRAALSLAARYPDRAAGEMVFSAPSSETVAWPAGRWRGWFRFETAVGVVDTTADFDVHVSEDAI